MDAQEQAPGRRINVREIPLSRGGVALIDNADYDRVMAAGPWYAHVKNTTVYAIRRVPRIDGTWTAQLLHRFLLGVTNPKIQVDHRNHDGLDNRRCNLRVATPSQNVANTRKRAGLTSRFKGVSWHIRSEKWQADIRVNGKSKHLGYFDNETDAACAYYRAACEHFGEFMTTASLRDSEK